MLFPVVPRYQRLGKNKGPLQGAWNMEEIGKLDGHESRGCRRRWARPAVRGGAVASRLRPSRWS